MVEPLDPVVVIKYILIALGLSVTFTNLFDCVSKAAPMIDYIMYVGVVFVGTILLVIIHSNLFLCGLLAVFGLITIYMNPIISVSWGIILLIFAKRIAGNMFFSVFIYIGTAIVLYSRLIASNESPSNAINILAVYPVVYFIDYLLYNKREGK